MVLNIKKLAGQSVAKSLKTIAYCATIVALAGCAGLNSTAQNANNDGTTSSVAAAMNNDALARVQARAKLIPNLETAQALETTAAAQQTIVDVYRKSSAAACYKRFLVNRCLDKLRNERNDAWDAAQIDRTAARLYIRTLEAENTRATLTAKINEHNQAEIAAAPQRVENVAKFNNKRAAHAAKLAAPQSPTPEQRAINVAAYESKKKAYAEKLATPPKLNAQNRADNVEKFNDKVDRLEALKKKRIADNQARIDKAMKKRADAVAKAAKQK